MAIFRLRVTPGRTGYAPTPGKTDKTLIVADILQRNEPVPSHQAAHQSPRDATTHGQTQPFRTDKTRYG